MINREQIIYDLMFDIEKDEFGTTSLITLSGHEAIDGIVKTALKKDYSFRIKKLSVYVTSKHEMPRLPLKFGLRIGEPIYCEMALYPESDFHFHGVKDFFVPEGQNPYSLALYIGPQYLFGFDASMIPAKTTTRVVLSGLLRRPYP